MDRRSSAPRNVEIHYAPFVLRDEYYERGKALQRDRMRKPRGKVLPPEIYRQVKFEDVCRSDTLKSQLAALGASTPSCVYATQLSKKEAKITNGRFSVNADSPGRHIAETFTDSELDNLINDGCEFKGREMPVFDRNGRRYSFELVYYENKASNGFYRFVGIGAEYERFMVDNNVVPDVVELGKKMVMQMFAFRSPKLLPKGIGFHDHQDGALGMIILFSKSDLDEDQDEDKYGNRLLDDDSMTIKEIVEHYPKAPEGYVLVFEE